MEAAYIIVTVAVTCTIFGGGYLLHRRLHRGWPRHNKKSNILTLREIIHMAALEEEMADREAEMADREAQFITHGQMILTQMQELDHVYGSVKSLR